MDYAVMAMAALLGGAVAWIIYDVRARRRAARDDAHDQEHDQAVARRALELMTAEVARRAGPAVASIVVLHEQLANQLRAEAAAANVRARVAERQMADAATPLQALSALVGSLRVALDRTEAVAEGLVVRQPYLPATTPPSAPPPAGEDDGERKTSFELGVPSATGLPSLEVADFDEEERTQVVHAPGGLRMLRPRPPRPPAAEPANDSGKRDSGA